MRLILILAAVVGFGILGYKGFQRIISADRGKKPATDSSQLASSPGNAGATRPPSAVLPVGLGAVEQTGLYIFRNRNVPEPPFGRARGTLGSKRDTAGLQLSVDLVANAWVMRGPEIEVEQLKRLGESLDIQQEELDLDFLLLAVSQDVVRKWGLTASFREGASWLSVLELSESGVSLSFGGDSVRITGELEFANGSVRLVSSPVVRCVTGEPWSFSTDTQVPIAVLQRSEGVVSTSYEYRSVGLGLDGTIYPSTRGGYRMSLEQRNGSVATTAGRSDGEPPELKEQMLRTALRLELGKWSCAGGVRGWRSEKVRGLLGKRVVEDQELLLIFARPRAFLHSPPRAWPIDPNQRHKGLDDWGDWSFESGPRSHPLLPAKPEQPWQAEERALIERKLGHPARK